MKNQTYVELEFSLTAGTYKIRKITGAITIPAGTVGSKQTEAFRVGNNLSESDAQEIAAHRAYKVTVK